MSWGFAQESGSRCVLCNTGQESHGHIFFDCCFSAQIWEDLARKNGIQWTPKRLSELNSWLLRICSSDSVASIVLRLSFSASV